MKILLLASYNTEVGQGRSLKVFRNRLEAILISAVATRTRLIKALLHKALEPAANAQEAAE